MLSIFLLLGTYNSQNKIDLSQVKQYSVSPKPEKDLWRYIVNRSTLSASNDEYLHEYIDWFRQHPDYLTRITRRAKPYLYLVTQEVERAGLPLEIALLPVVESDYYPFSYSHGTASGLWQFIPSTGKLYGLKESWWYDGRRDVLASTKAAVKYLQNLQILFKGDWLLAIAAYNSGPGRVQKAIKANKDQGKPTDFWHLQLPKETKDYVPKLLAVTELIRYPEKYGQTITRVINQPAVQSIELTSQFDIALIAQWSELEIEALYALNPGLKRWATPSEGTYTLLLPNDNMALFKQAMQNNPNVEKFKWVRYQVKSGDNLSSIAQKHKTMTSQITQINNLDGQLIKTGDYLIVPSMQKSGDYPWSKSQRKQAELNRKVIHTVVAGDNLWRIAKKYQVSVNNMIKWNYLKHPKLLKIGKQLIIWQPQLMTVRKDLSLAMTTGINIDRKVFYQVKSGDNLSVIAAKFDVTVLQIKQWNQLKDKPLQPGQKLTVMVNIMNTNMK